MTDVIDIKRKREEKAVEEPPAADADFDAIQKANKAKEERLKRDREKHNRDVTRDYRLK